MAFSQSIELQTDTTQYRSDTHHFYRTFEIEVVSLLNETIR